jgi:17beta-estradiol 17-dehydrogenase / very-long-chain 3-oxoacyl-CoA reductase
VKAVLANAGNNISSTPYPAHSLVEWVIDFLPEWLLVQQADSMHRDIRRRALAKKAKEAKKL